MNAVINAETRVANKSNTNNLRKEGFIPAVLYGYGIGNQPMAVKELEFTKLYREVGRNGIFSLSLNNETHPAMVYELQMDPIKNTILHVDFYKVNMKEEVEAPVPMQLVGEAPGEKNGGIVQQTLHELNVRALPANLPSNIEISIDSLEIGDTIQVKDLPTSPDYSVLNVEEETIVSILAPSVEEETEEEGAKEETETAGNADEE